MPKKIFATFHEVHSFLHLREIKLTVFLSKARYIHEMMYDLRIKLACVKENYEIRIKYNFLKCSDFKYPNSNLFEYKYISLIKLDFKVL